MGYTYTILALFAFSILGISYKLSHLYKCDSRQVDFFLFSSAALVLVMRVLIEGKHHAPPLALGAALGMAVAAVITIWAFRQSVGKGRVSTTWTITSLSLVIPTAGSMLIFGEIPNLRHVLGFALIFISIILLGIDIRRSGE